MPKPARPPPVAKRVPPVASGGPSNSLKDKSALVAGLLGRNMMLSGIKTSTAPARKEADEDVETERKAGTRPHVQTADPVKPVETTFAQPGRSEIAPNLVEELLFDRHFFLKKFT